MYESSSPDKPSPWSPLQYRYWEIDTIILPDNSHNHATLESPTFTSNMTLAVQTGPGMSPSRPYGCPSVHDLSHLLSEQMFTFIHTIQSPQLQVENN